MSNIFLAGTILLHIYINAPAKEASVSTFIVGLLFMIISFFDKKEA